MSKPNNSNSYQVPILNRNSANNSLVTQSQVIDSLTAHISLYHTSSPSVNPNPRSSILKWFSSLTVHQRQVHLTVVDRKFTQILIKMLAKLRNNGDGCFIILPDILSQDLPTICYKKSHGLLSRVANSNVAARFIYNSARLFGSKEGERMWDCSSSLNCLDSITMCEEFVENVDLFVETMDRVSNAEFLRGEESALGSDWVELSWLKEKGYYSVEALVANRLEVMLRLAWLNNSNGGKKKGIKLKEKLTMTGIAANVYWRKKGCLDWWRDLDGSTRMKILTTILGKEARSMVRQILKDASSASEEDMLSFTRGAGQPLNLKYKNAVYSQRTISTLEADAELGSVITPASLCGRPTSLASIFNGLIVLLDISTVILPCRHCDYDTEKLFFSTFSSINTISDGIFRILRTFLMILSLDCTKHELLGGENHKPLPNKGKGKQGASSRKKKGRAHNTKRPNPVSQSLEVEFLCGKPFKDPNCALSDAEKEEMIESKKIVDIPQGKKNERENLLSTVEMEHAQGLAVVKSQTAGRKNKKAKHRGKCSGLGKPVDLRRSEGSLEEASSSVDAVIQNVPNNDITGSECYKLSNRTVEDQMASSRTGDLDFQVDSKIVLPVPVQELASVSDNKDFDFQNSVNIRVPDPIPACSDQSISTLTEEDNFVLTQGEERGDSEPRSSAECTSFEWPSVASAYFPSVHSHLPAATDRLHLDVGLNWHNHFHRSFIPAMHQARKIPNEASGVLSQPLPMSLDWPPMVRSACGLPPSMAYNYDTGFISRTQSNFQFGFTTHNLNLNTTTDDERMYYGDIMDLSELASSQELADECDSHCISEEEFEVHAVSGLDYNQYFGGGVMYWDPSDHPGTGFSRPPSLSSEDSSWAWREADMNRAVDDMVAFSSSYSTNGLTSPTAASFCSPFDSLGPGHQTLSYVLPGNDLPGKVLHSQSTLTDTATEEDASGSLSNLPVDVEGKTGDSFPYPILRPIIIPTISRERSRSEFKRSHNQKSPCIPPTTRREQPRIKRPPSPVVLCVPRAPCPPAPSPVNDSRKHRGFPTVRSGSSSPRHWGMRGWYPDVTNSDEACMRMDGAEVVWPSWRNKNLPARPRIQSLPAALLQDRLIAVSQLARDQEHPDVAIPLQPPELQSCATGKTSYSLMHSLLHDEIDSFCKQVAAENLARKPYINWAVRRVTRSLQVLWPRSRTNIFGSNATGLSLPTSDVDLVVCLPPVRNLEPIKEAGILEGRNGIKETCLQHAARYLANQEWVKSDSLKIVENTAIPIIMLAVEVPCDLITSTSSVQLPKERPPHFVGEQSTSIKSDTVGLEYSTFTKSYLANGETIKDAKSVRLDISFKSPSHTGLQTTELVKELTEQFPAATPLALVLKQFLADRSLDQSYSGGLSSYCLVLLITRCLQHEHHLGRSINQNFGSLLMDFLYFFGNVFDPRQMCISVQGSGVYINRERGYSIDPIHIDDPLFPTNNVGRNCFRIHQCIKAFSEAYSILENELACLHCNSDTCARPQYKLLPKIIPSIELS